MAEITIQRLIENWEREYTAKVQDIELHGKHYDTVVSRFDFPDLPTSYMITLHLREEAAHAKRNH